MALSGSLPIKANSGQITTRPDRLYRTRCAGARSVYRRGFTSRGCPLVQYEARIANARPERIQTRQGDDDAISRRGVIQGSRMARTPDRSGLYSTRCAGVRVREDSPLTP